MSEETVESPSAVIEDSPCAVIEESPSAVIETASAPPAERETGPEANPAPPRLPSSDGGSRPRSVPGNRAAALRPRWQGGPRERLLRSGVEALSDSELLALLFGTGSRGSPVTTLAERMLVPRGLTGLAAVSPQELCTEPGIGPARAAQVVACFELGRRLFHAADDALLIRGPEDIYSATRDLRGARKEHFVTFYLNARNQVVARETVSIGSLNASIVHPREVYEPAVRNSAASLILVHNHPSGETDPSDDDLALTRRLVQVGELLGISVVDHVIVGKRGYTSFKQQGYL